MPWMRRMRKAGGKRARERARRAWGVDLRKMVRARRGPGIFNLFLFFSRICSFWVGGGGGGEVVFGVLGLGGGVNGMLIVGAGYAGEEKGSYGSF